jgi:hypothetical protein
MTERRNAGGGCAVIARIATWQSYPFKILSSAAVVNSAGGGGDTTTGAGSTFSATAFSAARLASARWISISA